jgi:CRP-like cAMP-binding protein
MLPPPDAPRDWSRNHLLARVPPAEIEVLAANLQQVSLRVGDMVYEPGARQQYAYFPTTAVVSLHYILESGASAEIAGVGNDGVVGVSLFMGGLTTPSSAVAQIAGQAYRLSAAILQQEFRRGGALQRVLLRYTQSMIAQMAQTAVCNRHHSIKQQLSRWLLLTQDRTPAREVVVTQEMIAAVLGVRRESVTGAAGDLQQLGLIRYRRGHISVVDRVNLEAAACECYGVVRSESNRVMASVG